MSHFPVSTRRGILIIAFVFVAAVLCLALLYNAHGFTHERQWAAQPVDVSSILYTPDGKTLLSTGDALRLWDPSTGGLKSSLKSSGTIAGISPDGNIIAVNTIKRANRGPADFLLELWDRKTGRQLPSIDHLGWSPAFSPDGKTVAIVTGPIAGGDSTIELWSLPAVARVASYPRTSFVCGACFSPNGKLLAVAERNVVKLLDASTGKTTQALTGPEAGLLKSLHFSGDGKTLLATFSSDLDSNTRLWTWDLTTGQGEEKIDFGHPVTVASFSDDGTTLTVLLTWYIFSRTDRIEVWDTTTARRRDSLSVRSTWILSVALSPDGQHVAVGFQRPGLGIPAPIGVWRVD